MHKSSIKKIMASLALLSVCTCYTMPVFAYTNEEAVYSKLDNNGKPYKTIVSTVENDGNKNNINQVEMEKDLPIECAVTYKLDGKEISAKDIAGKSGRVTIILKYTNKDEKEELINGKLEKMYTPFIVVSGVILDNEKNTNIEVNHGKVINNGEMTIAAGFAVPGLVESLNLEDNIDVCDTIEISMDAKDFELKNIMTYASPKVFGKFDIKLSDFNDLFNKVSTLQDASAQIENGAIQLNDGIIVLNSGVSELKTGSNTLANGMKSLNDGAYTLNSGAEELSSGISEYNNQSEKFNQAMGTVASGASTISTEYKTLDNGINSLNENGKALEKGAKNLDQGVSDLKDGVSYMNQRVSEASNGIGDLKTGTSAIKGGISKFSDGLEKVEGAIDIADGNIDDASDDVKGAISSLEQKNNTLRSLVESESDEAIIDILNSQISYNEELIEKLKSASGNIETSKVYISGAKQGTNDLSDGVNTLSGVAEQVDDGVGTLESGMGELKGGLNQLSDGASTLKDGTEQLYGGTQQLTAGTETLAAGSKKVTNGLDSLSTGTTELYGASSQLNVASNKIKNGANVLKNGTADLAIGATKLYNGSNDLVNGITTLSDGTERLADGSQTLVDGIKKFNNEGINEICNLVNNEGKSLIKRIEKLEELSKNYTQFASDKTRDDIHFFNIMDIISTADTDKSKNN